MNDTGSIVVHLPLYTAVSIMDRNVRIVRLPERLSHSAGTAVFYQIRPIMVFIFLGTTYMYDLTVTTRSDMEASPSVLYHSWSSSYLFYEFLTWAIPWSFRACTVLSMYSAYPHDCPRRRTLQR